MFLVGGDKMVKFRKKVSDFIEKYYYLIIIFLLLVTIAIVLIKPSRKVTNIVKEYSSNNIQDLSSSDDSNIKVEIKGMVLNPGVYELENGKRVNDLIEVSGGLLENANTNYLNLSKKLKDEMIIIVYSNDEINSFKKNKNSNYENIKIECNCPDTINNACMDIGDISHEDNITYENNSENKNSNSENKNSNSENKNLDSNISDIDSKISINEADEENLTKISGIGSSKAKSIIEYRKQNGNFKTIEDIMNVSGIGKSLFEKIKDYITV